MNRARIGLLMTAAAIAGAPAIAIAQAAPEEHHEHRDGDHGTRAAPPAGQDHRAAAPQAAPRPQAQPQQQQQQQGRPQQAGQPQGQRPAAPQGYGDRRTQNPGRYNDGGGRQAQQQQQQQAAQPAQDQGRRFNGGNPGRDGDRNGFNGNNPGRDNGGRDFRGGDRRPDSPPQANGGRDPRFNGQNGRNDNRGNFGRPGENRPAWRGDWRGDRRYDWHGYRDQNRRLFRAPRYAPPRGYGWGYRAFSIGSRLDPYFYAQGYWISDPFEYRLPPVYGPYRWVRYYDDVLLVDLDTGEVVDVIHDFFWE